LGGTKPSHGLASSVESIDPIDPSLSCGGAGKVSHQRVNSNVREANLLKLAPAPTTALVYGYVKVEF
jgi:hypothetical protein